MSPLAVVRAAVTVVNISRAWFKRQIDENMLVRRSVVLWAMLLITWTTHTLFTNPPPAFNAAHASGLGLIVGLLATAIGMYFRLRKGCGDDQSGNGEG